MCTLCVCMCACVCLLIYRHLQSSSSEEYVYQTRVLKRVYFFIHVVNNKSALTACIDTVRQLLARDFWRVTPVRCGDIFRATHKVSPLGEISAIDTLLLLFLLICEYASFPPCDYICLTIIAENLHCTKRAITSIDCELRKKYFYLVLYCKWKFLKTNSHLFMVVEN